MSFWRGDFAEKGRVGLGAAAVQAVEAVFDGKACLEERLAEAGPLGGEGQHHLVAVAGELAFGAASFVEAYDADAAQAACEAHQARSDDVVEVDEGVEAVSTVELPDETEHSARAAVVGLDVRTDDREVGRRVHEDIGHRRARDQHEAYVGIAQARAVDDRHGHGYVADGREAGEKHRHQAAGIALGRLISRHTARGWCRRRYTFSSVCRLSCTCVRRLCRRGGCRLRPRGLHAAA